MTIKNLIEKFQEYFKNNPEIYSTQIGKFDGGNDSGGVYFDTEKIGITLTEAEENLLYDLCDNALDYGSWAGDFSAAGEINYNKDNEITIEGNEINYYNSVVIHTELFNLNIPSDFYFDSIELYIAVNYGNTDYGVDFNINSGFETKEMEQWKENIIERLEEILNLDYSDDLHCFFHETILRKDTNKEIEIEICKYENENIYHEIDLNEEECEDEEDEEDEQDEITETKEELQKSVDNNDDIETVLINLRNAIDKLENK